MTDITFLNPGFFWLLLIVPMLIFWYFWKRNKQTATLTISSLNGFKMEFSALVKLKPILFIFRLLAICLIIIALARPQTVNMSSKTKKSRGIDIVMAIDISGSMLARDLKPNRLEALKKVATNFVNKRPNDRIGIVVYAAESYTRTPVTSDKSVIIDAIKTIKYDNAIQDGTAIGMGLSTAVNRLKESTAKSKVIILLTDGLNNTGFIEPITAAEITKEYGIKVYTIGIGSNGMADSPYAFAPNGELLFRKMPVEIDENLMTQIATTTNGKYFRATNNQQLEEIYDEINQLETSDVEELRFFNYDDKYRPLIWLAGLLLLLEITLRNTLFRSFI